MNPLNWVGPETTTALSLTLLHSLWQVGLAVGVLWCLERIWRRLPIERNYTLHAGMLLLALALLPMTFYWVQTTRQVAIAPVAPTESLTQLTPPPSAVVPAEFDLRPATQSPTEPAPEVNPTIAPPSEHVAAIPASNWWPVAAMWVAVCYVLGVLVMLSRLMLGIRRTERIRRRATHIEPGPLASTFARLARELGVGAGCVLATSRDVLVPTVVGIVKPTILLPASALTGLSASELEMILLHELAHVRRHDQWVNLVQRLAEVVLFFNPALWYLSRRIATLREYCCNELTCRQLSPGDTAAHVEYAATLLRVVELARPAGSVPAELTALAATGRGPSELRRRVARLFGEPLAEPVRLSRGGLVVVLSLVASIILAMAPSIGANQTPGQEKHSTAKDGRATTEIADEGNHEADPQRRSESNVPIQCLDSNKNPVAGAEVYVFQHEGGDAGKYRQFGPFMTDADGRATCGEAIFTSEDGHFDRIYYARVPGKLVGVGRSSNWKQWGTRNPEGKIGMRPSRSVSGKVTVPDGFDPTKVNVRVVNLTVRTGPEIMDFHSFPRKQDFAGLNTALPEMFECTPDIEGRFEFADVPIDGVLALVTDADGLGEGQSYTSRDDSSKPMDILLAKEGRLTGTVKNEKGEPLPGIKVAAQIHPVAGQIVGHLTTFRATSDDQGKYELSGLPEWDLVLRMDDPEQKFVFCPSAPFFVASGTEMTRDLTMEKPVEVRGRVVDAEGIPIEGATVSAITANDSHDGVTGATTDSDGAFTLRMPSGKFEIFFTGPPEDSKQSEPRLLNQPQLLKQLQIAPGQQTNDVLELTVPRRDGGERGQAGVTGTLQLAQSDSQPLLDVMAQLHGYKPAEGKVLARVAPPFDVIRLEYFRAANSSRTGEIDEGPSAMTFRWDGENLLEWGSNFGDRDDPGYTITGLLDVLMEQKPQSISGPKSLLDKPLAGDWVMRTGADRQQVIAELEEILGNDFGMKVRLRIRNLERDVYVATGRYQFKPLDESSLEANTEAGNGSLDRIQVFANKLTPDAGAGGGSGEVDRFLLMVGHWIGTPIVSEVGPPSQRHVSWRFHNTVGTTPEERRENHDAEIVLANITRQTGIEFKKDRRLIEVLFVEQDKEDVE